MKPHQIAVLAFALIALLAGCATTDRELTQMEKDKIARDMERESQKRAKSQEKMLREATQGTQRKGVR